MLNVLLLYNAPSLPCDHADYAQEAGVLESVGAVETALETAGHRVQRLGILSIAELAQRLNQPQLPDVVFNLCEGFGGRGEGETEVAELLESQGIAFTGSPSAALRVARNKVATKRLLESVGIETPPHVVVPRGSQVPHDRLAALVAGGPVFVKPASEDASVGISGGNVCRSLEAALDRIDEVAEGYGDVLIERFISGREFNVSVVALPEVRTLPIAEIVFAASLQADERIVSYEAKWAIGSNADRATTPLCPADVKPELKAEILAAALGSFQVIGCAQYARIDMRVSEQGEVFVLEVNANPDISPDAGLARALTAAGTSCEAFYCELALRAASKADHLAKL